VRTDELLTDAFTRIRARGHDVVDGLEADQLNRRLEDRANSISWLVWHLARVQDDHVAEVAGTEQVWTSQAYAGRAGLPFDDGATGYGQSVEEVGQVRVGAALLGEYADAVTDATLAYVGGLGPDDLERVVDDAWDPPVTLAVRLVSVISDDLQHVGQAGYAKGLLG
jgi:uncharacterized damage-inducible protein DinB